MISNDLHQAGIDGWFIHVLSKDEAGLKKDKIHSSNYIEQLDILRYGIIFGAIGFSVGLIIASLADLTEIIGSPMPRIVYYAIIGFSTLFGAWEGGLTGIATENKKIAMFHDDLDSGSYLILIYARKTLEAQVKKIMEARHPEAELVAVDASFYNPLSGLKRI